jgi:type III pantothenate kinase
MPDLAIAIGNTRIKAGIFERGILISAYAQAHDRLNLLERELGDIEFQKIAIASVVPISKLITIWHNLPQTQIITRSMIPLTGIYPTLGLDRILAGYAACKEYGNPVLVIDCGTAISLTGIDRDRQVIGGAILAGLTTQLKSLNISTSLPLLELPQSLDRNLPTRWATDTNTAIYSGLIYTVVAGIQDFIQDWRSLDPDSKIIFTGGDSELILKLMNAKFENIHSIYLDRNLILKGIAAICLISL